MTRLMPCPPEQEPLSTTVNVAESKLNMEKVTQEQLSQHIRILEGENAKLKEDLAFFEGFLSNATGNHGITIQRLTAEFLTSTQLRYRIADHSG